VTFAEVQEATGFELIDAVRAKPPCRAGAAGDHCQPRPAQHPGSVHQGQPASEEATDQGTTSSNPESGRDITYETDEPVLYEVADGVAWITMNRPGFNNAQNGQMTYALDDASSAR
jgi:hypothetical protein